MACAKACSAACLCHSMPQAAPRRTHVRGLMGTIRAIAFLVILDQHNFKRYECTSEMIGNLINWVGSCLYFAAGFKQHISTFSLFSLMAIVKSHLQYE